MLHSLPSLSPARVERASLRSADPSGATVDLLLAVLERSEVGVVVLDASDRAVYMNASARSILESPLAVVPGWLLAAVPDLRAQVERRGMAVDRAVHGELTVRLRARPLDRPGTLLVELAVASSSGNRPVADQLTRSLGLPGTDARLLALLWSGLSNEEIAQTLGVRTGTIKSRLFRLYQRLGVKKRAAAVLRAQEALAA